MKTLVCAVIATAVASLGASAASATTLLVTSAGAYDLGLVTLHGSIAGYGAYDRTVNAGPIVLKGKTTSGHDFSVVTFCFDILHPIGVGFGYQAPVHYTFSTGTLATDQSTGPDMGNALTMAQITTMSGLAKLGANLFINNSGNLHDELPAIQAAIWTTEYGFAATLANESAQALYRDYLGRSFIDTVVPTLTARDAQGQIIGSYQGQGLAFGAVPEPSTWGLLLVGFAGVGAMARRRRSIAAA